MKSIYITGYRLALCILLFSFNSFSQNVGIGTALPLDKLHVVGNIRSTSLAGVGNRLVMADPNGTLIIAGTAAAAGSPAWLVTGNSGLNGGSTTLAGVNFVGTTDAQNLDFRTNGIYRGRFSSLGEFFVGTLNTVIVGDLMNSVSNVTFPWAVNGYSSFNGGGVYGAVQSGSTVFGAVQGEYSGNSSSGAGVRGIAITSSAIGVSAQEPTLIGWGVLSTGDFGAILPANYWTVSDERLKSNITPVKNALQKITALNGYTYDVNQQDYPKYFPTNRRSIGFLAQEVEQLLPEAVTEKYISTPNSNRENPDKDVESMKVKAVSYNSVIPVMVEAIKEQQKIIEDLKARIEQLEKNR